MLVSVFTQNDKFTSEFSEINKKLTSIHQELSLLSSDYSDNKQVTHAIELARKGSSTKIIVGHDSPLAILIYFQVPGHDKDILQI